MKNPDAPAVKREAEEDWGLTAYLPRRADGRVGRQWRGRKFIAHVLAVMSEQTTLTKLDVFLSSPGDVQEER
jgi:hypothetical protein